VQQESLHLRLLQAELDLLTTHIHWVMVAIQQSVLALVEMETHLRHIPLRVATE
jgi:hypothetical protein